MAVNVHFAVLCVRQHPTITGAIFIYTNCPLVVLWNDPLEITWSYNGN